MSISNSEYQRIAFRVDASTQIGTGHFMRCLTLADELRKGGAEVCFICRDLSAHLVEMLVDRGISLQQLAGEPIAPPAGDLAHSHWLWTDQVHDAQASLQVMGDVQWDWVIVDHYALDHRWERIMRKATKKIMAIDDIADRRHDCDILLDQNYYLDMNERYQGKVPKQCRLLLGPRYALLREEFRELRKRTQPRDGKVRRILVFFGGVDAGNYTGLAIKALTGLELKDIAVDVVIGAQHPSRAEIEHACAAAGFACHVQTSRMAELMATADLAIGAGGSATWERCCLGLPALSVCVADNQCKQIADAAEQGLIYSLPGGDDLTSVFQRHIGAILENEPLRKLISRTAIHEVDGLGVNRVAATLGAKNIEIRMSDESDSPKLFEWRNHQTIRAVSKNSAPIAWGDHQSWFAKVQADKNRMLLIGEIDSESVGVVRFDQEGATALVSIYLVPEGGFKGQGRNLLLKAEEWLKAHRVDIKSIQAEVLGANVASQRLFMGADYRLESMHYLKEL